MRYPKGLPDTPEAKSWWEGAYAYFKEHDTKKGYPPLELPNGEKVYLHYVNNASKVNVGKGTGLKLRPKSQLTQDTQVRSQSLNQQTLGNTSLADTPTPTGMNDHHGKPRGVYQVFFEGLNEADSNELARFAQEDLLSPTGNHPANNMRIPESVHDDLHRFARRHPGLERGLTDKINGMNLEQRKLALKTFTENVQPALDEELFRLMQEYNAKNTNKVLDTARNARLMRLGNGIKNGARAITNGIPGPADNLVVGGLLAGGAALVEGLNGGDPVQAATNAGLDVATGDLDGGSLANGERTAHQNLKRDDSLPLPDVLFNFARNVSLGLTNGASKAFNGASTGRY